MHLDGRVQGGMQLRWWFGILFGLLVDFRKIDGWVSWGVLFEMLVTVRAHSCSIDCRVLLGACCCASTAIILFMFPLASLKKPTEKEKKRGETNRRTAISGLESPKTRMHPTAAPEPRLVGLLPLGRVMQQFFRLPRHEPQSSESAQMPRFGGHPPFGPETSKRTEEVLQKWNLLPFAFAIAHSVCSTQRFIGGRGKEGEGPKNNQVSVSVQENGTI